MRYLILLIFIFGCSDNYNVPEIGDKYAGGIIANIKNDKVWIITGTLENAKITCSHNSEGGKDIDNGKLNTKLLSENCPEKVNGINKIWNLSFNGYNDWFIPSINQLQKIFESGINMKKGKYWSSSCNDLDMGYRCPNTFYWYHHKLKGFDHIDSTYNIVAMRIDNL